MDKEVVQDGTSAKYNGKIIIDLTNASNLRKRKYCFQVSAMSRLGVMSEPFKVEPNVTPQVKNTEITVTRVPSIKAGTIVRYNFGIYDPSGLGTVTVTSIDDLNTILAGSSVVCEKDDASKWQLDCSALIDATQVTETKKYSFKIVTKNTLDSQNTATTHNIEFKVTP
ncbi:hypothetical protein D3C87_1503340 [compost metagenome]